jgi:hypothetical protein
MPCPRIVVAPVGLRPDELGYARLPWRVLHQPMLER